MSDRANPHYQELRNRIDSIITQDFNGATDYATVFEEHRKVYTFGQTWNFEAYSSKKKYECQHVQHVHITSTQTTALTAHHPFACQILL